MKFILLAYAVLLFASFGQLTGCDQEPAGCADGWTMVGDVCRPPSTVTDSGTTSDSGTADSGPGIDASTDGGATDGGATDGGTTDGGAADGGAADGAAMDGTVGDAATGDAAVDAGPTSCATSDDCPDTAPVCEAGTLICVA